MMKYIDTFFRHINTLIYHYLVPTLSIRYRDLTSSPFACSYDIFHNCSNHCHVVDLSTALVATTSPISASSTLHRLILRFFQSLSFFIYLYIFYPLQQYNGIIIQLHPPSFQFFRSER